MKLKYGLFPWSDGKCCFRHLRSSPCVCKRTFFLCHIVASASKAESPRRGYFAISISKRKDMGTFSIVFRKLQFNFLVSKVLFSSCLLCKCCTGQGNYSALKKGLLSYMPTTEKQHLLEMKTTYSQRLTLGTF